MAEAVGQIEAVFRGRRGAAGDGWVVASVVHDWAREEHIQCGYSSPSIMHFEVSSRPRVDMAQPHHDGRTVFCGEATNEDVNVTIQSAMGTGKEAARELLARLRLQEH